MPTEPGTMAGTSVEALKSEIARLIGHLLPCLKRQHEVLYGSVYDGRLHPAPSRRVLAAFLRNRGRCFPPSYRAFLGMHNGASGYVSGFTLVGAAGKHSGRAWRDIDATLQIFRDAWEAQYGPPTPDKIAALEAKSRDEAAYVARMIPFGTDFNGALLVFDPNTRKRDGEMNVLLWDSSGPSRRYRDFITMLRTDLREVKAQIREAEQGAARHRRHHRAG